LNNAKDNINRVQDIVQQKVSIALENERKELIRLRADNQRLQERIGITDNNNKTLNEEKKQLLDKIHGLNEDLAFYSRNVDARDTMKRIDILRAEKDSKDKKITELLHDINELSLKVEDFIAENRALRQMANVPDNYGIKLDQIKLHDKEKIDDFKKLIKVLQDDNYKLEEERAKLKHALKVQSMMYKSTDPSERFKGLT
jgi:predicted nuclease with TOPRIM domain